MIKKTPLICLALALSFLFTGCNTLKQTNSKQRGAAGGAAAGAILGGIIGNNVGNKKNTALGAVLGAVVGGLAGGVIGDRMDRQAERIRQEIPGVEVERVNEGLNVVFDEKSAINFAFNKAELDVQAKESLDKLARVFRECPDTNIFIQGYTDSVGKPSYNQTLSQRRAQSVRDYLSASGISSSRLTSRGFGAASPVASNDTDAGRARNRRVVFTITANEKMKQDAKRHTQR